MNDENFKRLLQDVVEDDPAYRRAREAAWNQIARERPDAAGGARRQHKLFPIWRVFATAACVALIFGALWFTFQTRRPEAAGPKSVASSLPSQKPPAQPAPSIVVEIVSTRDLPQTYVEIDDAALHQLFPHGIIVAYGKDPQVFTFE